MDNFVRLGLTDVRAHKKVLFSIGLASFETMPDSVDAMISAADQLMYEVKQERKGDIRQRVL